MKTPLAAAAMLSAATMAGSAANVPLKPGNYVITYQMEMNGRSLADSAKSGPRCLKPADMTTAESVFSQNAYNAMGRNPQCKITDLSSSGGKFTYDLVCPRSTDHVEAIVSGDTFTVTRTAKGHSNRTMTMVTRVNGRRVGDCSKCA
ncbi:MAG TPA: DUF3617 family protein [Vicinamibacterales bacterium]|jgi:hypothetical protein